MLIAVVPDHQRHPTRARRDWRQGGNHGNGPRHRLSARAALRVPERREPEEQIDGDEETATRCRTHHGALLPCWSNRSGDDGGVNRRLETLSRLAAIIA